MRESGKTLVSDEVADLLAIPYPGEEPERLDPEEDQPPPEEVGRPVFQPPEIPQEIRGSGKWETDAIREAATAPTKDSPGLRPTRTRFPEEPEDAGYGQMAVNDLVASGHGYAVESNPRPRVAPRCEECGAPVPGKVIPCEYAEGNTDQPDRRGRPGRLDTLAVAAEHDRRWAMNHPVPPPPDPRPGDACDCNGCRLTKHYRKHSFAKDKVVCSERCKKDRKNRKAREARAANRARWAEVQG